MGKNKLKKFAEIAAMDCVFEFPFTRLLHTADGLVASESFPMRGCWHERYFGNTNPIVLELGCGKGEYTVGLAERYPDKNFIGIDIKGARLWTGACQVRDRQLRNAAFLRTSIELLPTFFAPGEVAEIWITFPDPQMQKATKRLTGTRMMALYRRVLGPEGGMVRLKTDSPFLFAYTSEMARANAIEITASSADLYSETARADASLPEELRTIRTFYEQQWLARGLTIKYIAMRLTPLPDVLTEPDVEIEPDTYRSFSRGVLQGEDSAKFNN